ncbi:MAG: U32 family peptidase [Bacilli bacterium]|jgi:putative protease|nr:U32 family peptidase [Bacilli bacterium]
MKKPELLAPAGDLERLKIALLYGADAVYIGGPALNLRANAINFTLEDIKEGCEFAHSLGKRVHVTVNIVLHNKEIDGIVNYLKELEKCNVDAIIVSDPAIINLALKHTNLEVHLSTQASTLNVEACKFFKNLGVKRIVLGREVSKEDIKEIMDNVDIEIETFIHGAMCSSYSGRCVLSNFFTARDANRGGCAQICRWDFNLLDENKNPLKGEKEFTFCTKDLSNLVNIKEICDMGISSLKIEGRMRSIYYIATVVGIYRKVIDTYYNDKDNFKYDEKLEKVLTRCANRDSISQFFNGNFGKESQYYNGRVEVSNQDFLGLVLDYKDGIVTLQQRNYFKKGDVVEFFGPNLDAFEYTINEVYDEDGNQIDIVRHPKQIVSFKVPKELHQFDMMRIK